MYAACDLYTGRPCPALDGDLVSTKGTGSSSWYPLTEPDQTVLLAKMDAYCLEQAGMALADFRARYLAEAQQPHQAPGLAQLRACHWPRVGPVCRFLAEAGPRARLAGKPPRWGRFRHGLVRSIFVLG